MKKELQKIYYVFLILLLIIISGTVGYIYIENYTAIEAFYMTIITMSTVGYEEVHELSEVGMLFTAGLIIISFGVFGYLITAISKLLLSGEYKVYIKKYYMKKHLDKMKNHVIVCGFGRNGRQSVKELLSQGEDVVIIDRSDEVVEDDINEEIIANKKLVYLHGDASYDETLEKAHIDSAKAIIIALPNDSDCLLVTLTARNLNQNIKIIARASDDHSFGKLKIAGASNIIMPEKVGGTRMAKLVSSSDIIEFVERMVLKDGTDVHIEEISCNEGNASFIGQTIENLHVLENSGANLIGMKMEDGTYIFNPVPETVLQKDDQLFVIGKPEQIQKLKLILAGK